MISEVPGKSLLVDVAAHANLLCVARVPRPNPYALYRRCLLASSQAGANSRFICVALKASASYCSGTTVRLMLHPLCEPPHAGMVSKRLHGIIASCKVCIANRDVYVSVARATQGDRPAWVASLELLSTLPFALHLPSASAARDGGGSDDPLRGACRIARTCLRRYVLSSHRFASFRDYTARLRERPGISSHQKVPSGGC